MGRPRWESSFLEPPEANFFYEKLRMGNKKEKRSKKERTEGRWKLAPLMEIRPHRGFPRRLEKSLTNDVRLFHSFHRPDGGFFPKLDFEITRGGAKSKYRKGPNQVAKHKLTSPMCLLGQASRAPLVQEKASFRPRSSELAEEWPCRLREPCAAPEPVRK